MVALLCMLILSLSTACLAAATPVPQHHTGMPAMQCDRCCHGSNLLIQAPTTCCTCQHQPAEASARFSPPALAVAALLASARTFVLPERICFSAAGPSPPRSPHTILRV